MSGGGALGNSEDAEIAALEAENTALRADAHALLQHQALLERLLAEARAADAERRRVEAEAAELLGRMRAKLTGGGAAADAA
jgi:hypothetical protein